jgi:methylated-DNA-[protein]-cysteine S-methyltransferase
MRTAWISKALPTPFGQLWVAVSETGLVGVEFNHDLAALESWLVRQAFDPILAEGGRTREILEQIRAYLAGERREFDLAIDWSVMRPFQARVLQAMLAIPYGQTRTYAGIAAEISAPAAARAVGRAGATNPMPLVIPCHRVIGSDGKLHGYGGRGGLATKAWLLEMESRNSDAARQ